MVADNFALGKTLRPSGTDVVRVENFEHIGARVAHEAADAYNYQSDCRQNEMLRDIKNCLELRGVFGDIISAVHAADVKPPEFYRENELQQGAPYQDFY